MGRCPPDRRDKKSNDCQSIADIIVAPAGEPTTAAMVYRKEYEFTGDYFTVHLPCWKEVLDPYKGKSNVNYLEIGVYEGGSLLWMLENILTADTARATAIDIFAGSYKDTYFKNVELSGFADKVTTIAQASQIALRGLPLESFDLIYIDGSHFKNDVLEDAVLSWRLLKKGGLMIFDDYREADACDQMPGKFRCPKMAIDPFVQCFEAQCEVIHNEWQLIIRKL